MSDKVMREGANSVAETQNNLIQRGKHLIFKAQFPDFFPNLLNRIHFGRIWRDKEEADVIRDNKGP